MRLALSGTVLVLALSGCAEHLAAVPGSEREARWDACDGGPVGWHCPGSGPVRRVYAERVLLGVFAVRRWDERWERYDPRHPGASGARLREEWMR